MAISSAVPVRSSSAVSAAEVTLPRAVSPAVVRDFASALRVRSSWSCSGPGNVGGYCDPGADSLLQRAIASPKADRALWHSFLRRVEESAPAAFMYTQSFAYAVNRRFRDVTIRPESSWIARSRLTNASWCRVASRAQW